jgi:hypothetical protein
VFRYVVGACADCFLLVRSCRPLARDCFYVNPLSDWPWIDLTAGLPIHAPRKFSLANAAINEIACTDTLRGDGVSPSGDVLMTHHLTADCIVLVFNDGC